MPSSIPDLPPNGQRRSARGASYVTHATALGMGFNPPFLWKHRARNHPALGRPIDTTRQTFRHERTGGVVTHHEYLLYSLTDLTLILDRRARASDGDGAAPVNGYRPQTVRMPVRGGGEVVCVQFVRVRPPRPKRRIPTDERISLPVAAERWGIELATLHTWTRRGCPLLGRKLPTTKRPGRTCDVDCIDPADFRAIDLALREARAGRLVRAGRVYLSPLAADHFFVLHRGSSSARRALENCRRSGGPAQGKELRRIKGCYLGPDRQQRMRFGKWCYDAEDLAQLFRPRRPIPPMAVPEPEPAPPIAASSPATVDASPDTLPESRPAGEVARITRPGKPGRKPGYRDTKADERNHKMREAHEKKNYKTIAALAAAFHVSRTLASRIVRGRLQPPIRGQ